MRICCSTHSTLVAAASVSIGAFYRLQVPSWFVNFRWLLIPQESLKGITIMLKGGHLAYLRSVVGKRLVVLLSVRHPGQDGALLAPAYRRRDGGDNQDMELRGSHPMDRGCRLSAHSPTGPTSASAILPIYPMLAVAVGAEFATPETKASINRVGLGVADEATLLASPITLPTSTNSSKSRQRPELSGGFNFDWGQGGKL